MKARAGLARSRRRLAAADPADATIKGTLSRRSQRGAVTRGKKALQQAKKDARVRLAIGPKKGVIRKPRGGKPGTLAERRARKPTKAKPSKPARPARPPIERRLAAFEAKLKARVSAWAEESRKANNALNRNNDTGWTPRAQKAAERVRRADRQGRSLQKALRAFRRLDTAASPSRYGFARGSTQRRELAEEIRSARKKLAELRKQEKEAKNRYQSQDVVRLGLTSEIGGNRRQSRKRKQAESSRLTGLVDDLLNKHVAANMQKQVLAALRGKAKEQTRRTNAARLPRSRKR